MRNGLLADLAQRTAGLRDDGLFKSERVIASPQSAHITLADGSEVLNLCANNYLGLADHPELVAGRARGARRATATAWPRCASSAARRPCTRSWRPRSARFLGTDDTILYSSCFDANGGLFETILDEQDCVISDALNHASIIDGIRLCKAQRLRYDNNDMAELEQRLHEAADARYRLIATDGVFSMDGVIADLPAICDLAERYDAMVMVDDSHAVGFVGAGGRGTPEHCGVMGRVDIITGTLGKALGGAVGRLHQRPQRDHRLVAPALAALPVLQLAGAGDRGDHVARARAAAARQRPARQLQRNATGSAPAWTRPASRSPAPATRSSR